MLYMYIMFTKANRKRRTDYVSSYPQHRDVLNVMQALATHAELVTERKFAKVVANCELGAHRACSSQA